MSTRKISNCKSGLSGTSQRVTVCLHHGTSVHCEEGVLELARKKRKTQNINISGEDVVPVHSTVTSQKSTLLFESSSL